METKYQEVFSQYNFKIHNSFRIRGAHIIETNIGPKLFKGLECSVNHVNFENEIQQVLVKRAYPYLDLYVPNSKKEIITTDSMGNQFFIKDWYSGLECDLKQEEDVLNGVANLACIHNLLRNVPISEESRTLNGEINLNESFEKRIRELKRVRSYIKQKRKKKEFELSFLDCYDHFFDQATLANELLKASQYDNLLKAAQSKGHVCHGNYTYHNLIFLGKTHKYNERNSKQIITTNFDRAVIGIQINDLYHFIRKTMEKTNWDIKLGNKMIKIYNSTCAISKEEAHLLYILLLYPEKFWKVSNHYYNGKKTWVPKRTIQKLEDVKNQTEDKDKFLKQLKGKL